MIPGSGNHMVDAQDAEENKYIDWCVECGKEVMAKEVNRNGSVCDCCAAGK